MTQKFRVFFLRNKKEYRIWKIFNLCPFSQFYSGSYTPAVITLSSLLMAKHCIVCDEDECWPLPSPMASATPLKVHRRVRESLCLHRHCVDGNAPPSPHRPPSSVSPSVSARHKHTLKPNKQNPVVMWARVPDPTMLGPSLHPETKLDSTREFK